MDKLDLKVTQRTINGRKVKNLRKEGVLPGNIYGKNLESTMVQVDLKDFEKVFAKAGETGLVQLQLDKKEIPVLIHSLQMDPVSGNPLHADFMQVNLKEKVTAQIPIELVGEAPAEKQGVGTAVQYLNEIEVEALPGDLLDKFEIDITNLSEVEQTIHVRDINVDKSKIEVKTGEEEIVVKVEAQKEEPTEIAPTSEDTVEEGDKKEEEPTSEESKEEQS